MTMAWSRCSQDAYFLATDTSPITLKTGTGALLPFNSIGASDLSWKTPFTSAAEDSEIKIWSGCALEQRRELTFTASPMTV